MLDRINEEIKLCFMCAEDETNENTSIKDTVDYKAAAVLIKAYNQLVRLRYLPEYQDEYLKKSVDKEYKIYKEYH